MFTMLANRPITEVLVQYRHSNRTRCMPRVAFVTRPRLSSIAHFSNTISLSLSFYLLPTRYSFDFRLYIFLPRSVLARWDSGQPINSSTVERKWSGGQSSEKEVITRLKGRIGYVLGTKMENGTGGAWSDQLDETRCTYSRTCDACPFWTRILWQISPISEGKAYMT